MSCQRIRETMDVLVSALGSEISTSRGDIYGKWSFSMRSTLIDLDVLPDVYLFLWGGNFTSRGRNKYVQIFFKHLTPSSIHKYLLAALALIIARLLSSAHVRKSKPKVIGMIWTAYYQDWFLDMNVIPNSDSDT